MMGTQSFTPSSASPPSCQDLTCLSLPSPHLPLFFPTACSQPTMQIPRRKSPRWGAAELLAFRGMTGLAAYHHKGAKLPIVAVVVAIFLFAMFMYSEDIRSLAEISFGRAASGDLALRDFSLATPAAHNATHVPSPPKSASSHKRISKRTENEKGADPDPIVWEANRTNVAISAAAQATEGETPVRGELPVVAIDVPEGCDLSTGEWVFDNVSYPLYREEECRFLTEQVTCIRNGRRDDKYQKWRWQPRGCSLPKFDARLFMERLRGKRLMFVGDSLNRNQWESMVCLVQSVLSPGKKNVTEDGNRTIFHAEEYNATVEFYWAPFLVASNSDDPKIHSILHRMIRAEAIEGHAAHWRDVDYLVFNSYIWWMNTLKMKVQRPEASDWSEHDEVVRIEAYGRVLRTWSDWIGENVDPRRTSVFFMSVSPLHLSPHHWYNPDGIKCAGETLPVLNFHDPIYIGNDRQMFDLAANVTASMVRVPVTFVDITTMSDYRKDAHTSVYTIRQGKLLTPEQKADPATYADCIHWCLPGVPDIWNLILYTKILSKQT